MLMLSRYIEREVPDEVHLDMRRRILDSILEDIHTIYPRETHAPIAEGEHLVVHVHVYL